MLSRTHRGLVVTEAGKSIYNDTKYIIGYCKESVKRAKEAMQTSDDVIRVGISREKFCAAVSIHHRLAKKKKITLNDLEGESLMLMHRNWSHYVDEMRDELTENHPDINIVDFDFYRRSRTLCLLTL